MPPNTQDPNSAPLPPSKQAAAGTSPPENLLDSRTLLQGQRAIAIVHNGTVYRLQATRQGKLILTK